ncbi:hypothetical protein HX793_21835 [Pseudomonas reactans]|uniref:hypothetical protein n=1 Tax=Pseudomonas TaxID=286 RepID=UPI0015A010CA|nr:MULTISPECIES: hypothetical protein [Pseudomonas]NWA46603.1 hypothetical protein [Pseudomonas reactans]NWC39652.1 hypothetical protein [Pseudomonas tolaasii]NWC90598.1 hypothetical protein [Pseudomonas reactans]NWD32427.1 hypothetical protein [Pseudomonas reactans]NWF17437.1 hypothetical protein [Pseudomonas reactans]
MQKLQIVLSTLTILLLSNTALAAITWPAEQTYEESLGAETWSTSGGCKSGQQISMRRVFFINKDGSKNYVNKGNGIFVKGSESYGDGFEILSKCYDSTNTVIEEAKISEVVSEVISQKCENPLETGSINKRREYTLWSPDRANSNFKTGFNVMVTSTCQLKETKVFDNPVCATKNPDYPLGAIYGTWTRTIKDGVPSEWALNQFNTNVNKCYKTVTETENPTCPTGYTGQMTQSRTYDLWTTGSQKNDSGFVTIQDTCSKNESQQLAKENCPTINPAYPLGTTNGLYSRTVTPAGITSDWKLIVLISNSCYYMKDTVVSTNEASCPTGQTGKIVRETHVILRQYLSSSQNDSSYIVEKENTCKASGPVTVEVKPGTQTVSCDSYFGVQQNTYSGNVTKTGDNLTIFDPVSGSTNTTFQAKTEDTTSCVKEITTTTKEFIEEECPAGFLGKITKYLIKAESSTGTVYPYGTTPILDSNTCIAVSISDEINAPSAEHLQDSVLSNLSFTTTSISKSDLIIDQLNKIDTSKLEGKAYVMNINADNLSAGVFDKNKITNLVKTFKTKLGQSANVKISSVPVTLDKYINQDGLTQSRIRLERLSLSGTSVNNGTVTVKYVSLAKSTPQHFSFTVKVFE